MTEAAIIASRLQMLGVQELSNFNGVIIDLATDRFAILKCLRLVFKRKNRLRLVLGDPFSRIAQTMTLLLRPASLVIVEDGADTHRAFRDSGLGVPLARSHSASERSRTRDKFQELLRFMESEGRVNWMFSSSLLFASASGSYDVHCFKRLRDSTARTVHLKGRLVLGSALCADGFIYEECYYDWLRSVLTRDSNFVAHRREEFQHNLVGKMIEQVNVEAVESIEELAASLTEPIVVYCLPTSPVLTLPSVLPPDSRLEVARIPESWWTPGATPELRELICRIADRAACAPGLE